MITWSAMREKTRSGNYKANEAREENPPSTRPNMPMGDEEMECGSDDPLGIYFIKHIIFQHGVSTVTIL